MTDPRLWIGLGAFFGLVGVAMGAFGAHALSESLTPKYQAVYQTAAQYQMYHALALFAVAYIASVYPSAQFLVRMAGWAFTVGILLFSGSLYALAISGIKVLGAITPIGGVAFLVGWGSLLFLAIRG